MKDYSRGIVFFFVLKSMRYISRCTAREQDRKYWGNPQVYITSAVEAAPYDAHFTLYNFKTNSLQPLDDDVKSMNVMGELRYQVSSANYRRKLSKL